jgi:hypothetical protein
MKLNSTKFVAAVYDRKFENHLPTSFLAFFAFFAVNFISTAQIQQAWVARYNNGITNGTNQAVKMTLDTNGNIYITGFSQNTNGQLGYATMKYAPNGTQLWAARYDSTNYPNATPSGLVLDNSNNVVVTGSALTVKYDTNGNRLWTAPYAGTALAADTNGNIIVTGFGTNFNTVKLSPQASNLWTATYKDVGPTRGQAIVLDTNGNAYVSGSDTYGYTFLSPAVTLTTVKYDTNGNQLWAASPGSRAFWVTGVLVAGCALDSGNNLYIAYQWKPLQSPASQPYVIKLSSSGVALWGAGSPDAGWLSNVGYGLAVDMAGDVFITGQFIFIVPNEGYAATSYGTYKANRNGSWVWTNSFPAVPMGASVATSVALDSLNNCYVTGYSPGTNAGNDIVTIKYDNNGNQIWLQRYNGPGNGDDEGNAIAVDANGNVYVAGYETTAAGGTEMVLIKYAPGPFLKKQANGSMLLQAAGAAGEGFDFQASTNLVNWQDLGTNTADSNGLVQFLDTNAPLFPYRFYLANPQQ